MAALDRLEASVPLRRALRRVGHGRPARSAAPARPVGVKLELTHRCNLRCGFCYTDSPRHTLARTADLPDDDWRRVVDESIQLGVIEAVLIGGEPLLRRDLVLDLLGRLSAAGVGTSVTTNGWFLDADFADRLAELRGVTFNVSIDGASPAVHDAARGVPGSWRRAVDAVDLLLERDVAVEVIHVVTPDNADGVDGFLEQMWLLGAPRVLLVPVAQIGAAARSGRWRADPGRLRAAARRFRRRHPDMDVSPQPRLAGALAEQGDRAPASLLVHANGVVVVDSLHPFAFGHAARDGVAECWGRIVAGWDDPGIDAWARGVPSLSRLHDTPLVAYRDEPVEAGEWDRDASPEAAAPEPPPPVPSVPADADLPAAREHVRSLALSRRHRVAGTRVSVEPDGGRYVRVVSSGRVVRLNHTAGIVMDACDAEGTAAAAIAPLRARHSDLPAERAENDVLAGVRLLHRHGIVAPVPRPRVPGGR